MELVTPLTRTVFIKTDYGYELKFEYFEYPMLRGWIKKTPQSMLYATLFYRLATKEYNIFEQTDT